MATFTHPASKGSRSESNPRILSNKFGDGYEQRIGDGINTLLPVWQLQFNTLSQSDANSIVSFFESHAGVTAFDWTPPTGSAGKFVCKTWTITPDGMIFDISATFEKVPA